MLNTKHVGYYFRHPLMAVMLLWALTLPGQEVAFYSFLFHGTSSHTTFQIVSAPSDEDESAVQKQGVQAFQDAKVASYPVLHLPQLIKNPVLLLAFAAPTDEPLPAFAARPAGVKLLAQLLPAAIQPNAP